MATEQISLIERTRRCYTDLVELTNDIRHLCEAIDEQNRKSDDSKDQKDDIDAATYDAVQGMRIAEQELRAVLYTLRGSSIQDATYVEMGGANSIVLNELD